MIIYDTEPDGNLTRVVLVRGTPAVLSQLHSVVYKRDFNRENIPRLKKIHKQTLPQKLRRHLDEKGNEFLHIHQTIQNKHD